LFAKRPSAAEILVGSNQSTSASGFFGLARVYANDPYFNTLTAEEENVAIRLASIDKARNRCLDRLEQGHNNIVTREKRKARWTAPQVGDLVLLRSMALDGQHGHKLKARWEGPYVLDDVHPNGRAGRLRDIHSGTLVKVKASGGKERMHLDNLKVFIPPAEADVTVNAVALREWWCPDAGKPGGGLSFDLNTW
jgi:hypothetical protein